MPRPAPTLRVCFTALHGLVSVACMPGARFARNACQHSEFTAPETTPVMLQEFARVPAPGAARCGLRIWNARERPHGVFVTHTPNGFVVSVTSAGEPASVHEYEAPLDDDIGAMIQAICTKTMTARGRCLHLGRDGTYYLLTTSAPATEPNGAVTWSPRPETPAHGVVAMFEALRAYATAPRDVKLAAGHTAYRAVTEEHVALFGRDEAR